MAKSEIGVENIAGDLTIIDAYIIDELNEINRRTRDEGLSPQLPYSHYEMELDEVAEDVQSRVIIIEFEEADF